jgi:hypothetical protein
VQISLCREQNAVDVYHMGRKEKGCVGGKMGYIDTRVPAISWFTVQIVSSVG